MLSVRGTENLLLQINPLYKIFIYLFEGREKGLQSEMLSAGVLIAGLQQVELGRR